MTHESPPDPNRSRHLGSKTIVIADVISNKSPKNNRVESSVS
jgi:hypothetical protein